MLLIITLSHNATRDYADADNLTRAGLFTEWAATARQELARDPELTGVEFRHSRTSAPIFRVLVRA